MRISARDHSGRPSNWLLTACLPSRSGASGHWFPWRVYGDCLRKANLVHTCSCLRKARWNRCGL